MLVVITVIGVLVGMSASHFLSVKNRARDAARKADLVKIQRALMIYYDQHDMMPPNKIPGSTYNSRQPDFLEELVQERLLMNPPKDPLQDSTSIYHYYYYDYGRG